MSTFENPDAAMMLADGMSRAAQARTSKALKMVANLSTPMTPKSGKLDEIELTADDLLLLVASAAEVLRQELRDRRLLTSRGVSDV